MPTPRKGEEQGEFVSRCIGEVAGEEGPDGKKRSQKQVAAMCYQMWRDRKKEIDEDAADEMDTKEHGRYGVPWGVHSFAQLKAALAQEEALHEMAEYTDDFFALSNNIITDESVTDKNTALKALVDEYTSIVGQTVSEPEKEGAKPLDETDIEIDVPMVADAIGGFKDMNIVERVIGAVSDAVKSLFKPKEADPGFTVYKDATTGDWRWLAIFSNKYRDRDNPPEIITDAAHQDFVAAVDKGEYPYPELWLWHVPGTRWGQADYVAYDDKGFAIASGTVDKDKAHIAEALSTDDVLVSHGMPAAEVFREDGDGTIITRYRSKEVSVLPAHAAANELTGFSVVEGGQDMPLPKEKRDWLKTRIGEAAVTQLEVAIEQKARIAEEVGLEFKETEPEPQAEAESPVDETQVVVTEETKEAEDTKEAEVVETPVEEPVAGNPAALTQDSILEAFSQAVAPLIQRIEALEAKAITPEPQAEAEPEVAKGVPAASLADLIRTSVIGSSEALLRKNDPLLKQKPAETEPEVKARTGIPVVDAMIAGQDWRTALTMQDKEVE